MKIYTLTLNPAFDVHAKAEAFSASRENFADITSRDAGGKGVNISRALQAVGVPNTAIVVIGKENGAEFKNDLAQFGLNTVYLEKDGRIRENLTLHHGGEETRISFSGFAANDALLSEVAGKIVVEEDTYVTFTGSIPAGISNAAAIAFLAALKEKGAKLVVDCRSFDLRDICQIGPWLVKPNQQEISQWFGSCVHTLEQAKVCAGKLHSMGVENAMISLGAQGAVLACHRVYSAAPPKVRHVSTIGAGDSSIAGFLAAVGEGRGSGGCLRSAVAFGTAACLTEGTLPPDSTRVDSIRREILLTEETL